MGFVLPNASMKLNPDTTVARLLGAIPSSASVFERFGIQASSAKEKTLEEVCKEQGVVLEELLETIEALDWANEFNGVSASPRGE